MEPLKPDEDSALAPASLRVRLLGPSELVVGGRQISQSEWSGRKARSLLLLLLDAPGHAMPRDQVLDLLWPDYDPDAAANALYKAMHGMRRVLEPALQTGRKSRFVELQGDTVALAAGLDLWIDAEHLAALIKRAETASPDDQRRLYREGLALVRGEYIADEPYADWVMMRGTGIRAEIVRITLRLAKLDLEAGEPLDAIPALEALLSVDPTLEAAHRALMHACVSAGLRSDALRQFEVCREQLRQDLGEEPEPETIQLAAAIRDSFAQSPDAEQTGADLAAASGVMRHALPSLPTPTVGRQVELAALMELMLEPEVRVVTITGTGGVGKTRLARQLAIELAPHYAGEMVYVALAAIRDAELALAEIGAALGVAENAARTWTDLLTERLRSTSTLLVLDNLEQIADVANALAELVEACPDLQIVATSRVPLRIRAEHCFKLDVLDLPPASSDASDLQAFGATALFLQTWERLHRNRPEIDRQDRAAIAAICRHLDGLPLAIEIAASHCYERTPRQIWSLLQERSRVSFLRDGPRDLPERHRTLTDLIEWSYQLLQERSKRLFRTLSVFAGGIEQDALAAVAGEDAWQLASELADQHLISWTQVNGVRRIEMLETVREVAQEMLAASGDAERDRDLHLDFYARSARQSDAGLRGPRQIVWFDRLERDLPNLRAALAYALGPDDPSGRLDAALAIVTGTWLFWFYRGHVQEAITWLDRLAPQLPNDARPELRGFYLAQLVAGRRVQDKQRVEQALALARAVIGPFDHDSDTLMILIQEGVISRQHGDLARSRDQLLSVIQRARAAGDTWAMAEAMQELNTTHLLLGEFTSALEVLEQAGELSRRAGDILSESNAFTFQATAALQAGDFPLALESAREAERLCRLVDNRSMLPWPLYVQAAEAFYRGDNRRAIGMLREVRQLFAELGNPRNRASVDTSLAAAYTADGDYSAARFAFLQAIPATSRHGFSEDKTTCLSEVALFVAATGPGEQAVRLLAASASHADRIGQVHTPPDEQRRSRMQESLLATMGQAAFDTAWQSGLTMTLDDAHDIVRQTGAEPLQRAS